MALFITIPASDMTPKNAINPKDDSNNRIPNITPISSNGIVDRTIKVFLAKLQTVGQHNDHMNKPLTYRIFQFD
jgi:hypothetical protein